MMQTYAGLRDASSIGAATRVQVIQGFVYQPVEPPRGFVFGGLATPSSGIKLRLPSAKCRHLIRRQLLDRCFDFFDGTYGRQYTDSALHHEWSVLIGER